MTLKLRVLPRIPSSIVAGDGVLVSYAGGVYTLAIDPTAIPALDADLAAIAGLTSAADKGIQFTGVGQAGTYDLTAYAKTLLDDVNAGAVLSTLGISAFIQTLLDDANAGAALSTLGVSSYAQTLLDDANAAAAQTTLGVSAFAQTLLDDTTAIAGRTTLGAAPLAAMAFNNIVINGAVAVSQELGTTGATLSNNTAKYTADCWEGMYNHGAATAVVTSGQVAASAFSSTLLPFQYGHQLKATTAITAPANGDFAKHRTKIKGYQIAEWGWGAAGAYDIVVAFKYYSTGSGTAFVKLSNSDQSRCYYHEITVAAGVNFYAFTVPGDITGTWQVTTLVGLTFEVFSSGKETTPASVFDTWGTTNKVQTTNSTNLLGTNNNLTILTGVYIAAGTQLPVEADLPRLMRHYTEEYERCLEFVWKVPITGITQPVFLGHATGATTAEYIVVYPRQMHTTPTMAVSAQTHFGAVTSNFGAINAGTGLALNGQVIPGKTARLGLTGTSGLTAGDSTWLYTTDAAASMIFKAQL